MSHLHFSPPKPIRPVQQTDGQRTGTSSFGPLTRYLNRLSARKELLSAYPETVTKILPDEEIQWPAEALKTNDRISIEAGQLVPCDGILATDKAVIDYLSGDRVERRRGELIYAGALIVGLPVVLKVHEAMSRGTLMRLIDQRTRQQGVRGRVSAFPGFSGVPLSYRKLDGAPLHTTVRYEGTQLTENDLKLILLAVRQCEEPYAQAIRAWLEQHVSIGRLNARAVVRSGRGISLGGLLRLGTTRFTGARNDPHYEQAFWLRIDGELAGKFFLTDAAGAVSQLTRGLWSAF